MHDAKKSETARIAECRERMAQVPLAREHPDRAGFAIARMRPGVEVGWLTIRTEPTSAESRIACRCRCGSSTFPLARDVSEGRVRSCGLAYCPTTGRGHGL